MTDYSHIWDEGMTYRHDDALKLLDAFNNYLTQLGDNKDLIQERINVIDILIERNKIAVIWKVLLKCAIAAPDIWGPAIFPLICAVPILKCPDTNTFAGNFLKVFFGTLKSEDREIVERTILAISNSFDTEHKSVGEHIRNRLLGCLIPEMAVTAEAKELIDELASKESFPPNDPPFQITTSWGKPYGEKEYLAEGGVPVEADPNQRIQALEAPIKEFAKDHSNKSPSLEETMELFPHLQKLADAVMKADGEGVHPKQRDYAWGCLAEACAKIAASGSVNCDSELGIFIRQVLLQAAENADPVYDPTLDRQFDEGPSWGKPAPRIDAAEGLMFVAKIPSCVNDNVFNAIERLSRDPVPAVRYHVVNYLTTLYQTQPELMWRIVDRFSREEQSRGVLQGLIAYSLNRLSGVYGDRVADITKIIFDRVTGDGPDKKVRGLCSALFTGLYLWQEQKLSFETLVQFAKSPLDFLEEAQQIITTIDGLITHGSVALPDPKAEGVRTRAFFLLNLLLNSISKSIQTLIDRHKDNPEAWQETDQIKYNNLLRLADAICMKIYFASGAFKRDKSDDRSPAAEPGEAEKRRFLYETTPMINGLAEFGHPRIVHHLVETLETLIELDPRRVFLLIGRIIQSGKPYGYQYDSMAERLMVRLIERFLAEYRTILREDQECRNALIEILDTFIGWTSARRLTYRLEEIFR